MAEKEKAQYAAPGSQVDLKRRQDNDNKSDRVLSTSDEYEPVEQGEARDYRVEGNNVDGYIGTSPEYATYANETEAPLKSKGDDDNPESLVFESFAASPVPATLKVDGNVEYEGEKKQKEDAAKASEDARASADSSSDTTGEGTEAAKKATAPKSGN